MDGYDVLFVRMVTHELMLWYDFHSVLHPGQVWLFLGTDGVCSQNGMVQLDGGGERENTEWERTESEREELQRKKQKLREKI